MKNNLQEGVLYSLFGNNAVLFKELSISLNSLKSHNSGIQICLVTNNPNIPVSIKRKIDKIILLQENLHFYKLKVLAFLQTPFERTIFLDLDTKIQGNISELFEFLKLYDIAIAHDPLCDWSKEDYFLAYFNLMNYNTGVLAYRKNNNTTNFFKSWLSSFINQDDKVFLSNDKRWDDQDWFNKLIHEEKKHHQLGLKLLEIPNTIYNSRPWIWKALKNEGIKRRTKITHSHNLPASAFEFVYKSIIHKFKNISMYDIAKQLIKKSPYLESKLKSIYKKIKKPGLSLLQKTIRYYSKIYKNVQFIQIGSNNGVSGGDPIFYSVRKDQWRGILVEPVKEIFDELVKNYHSCPKLIFENCAIANEDGYKTFYSIRKTENQVLPEWYNQIGSFNKDVILKHKYAIPDIENMIVEERIKTYSFTNILRKHDFYNINLIHIDVEGFDYEIIKTIDFNLIQPDILIYEHKHLNPDDYTNCRNLVLKQGFKLFEIDCDTLCINEKRKNIIEHIEQAYYN